MGKLEEIFTVRKLKEKLIGFREKEIRRKIEAKKDECKKTEINWQISYEESVKKLSEKEVDYDKVINEMVAAKVGIANAKATFKIICEIEKDLD